MPECKRFARPRFRPRFRLCLCFRFRLLFLFIALLAPSTWGLGEVVKIEILSRQIFANGMKFGNTGAYEKIRGRLHYAVDPANPANTAIVDLSHAPKNSQGLVEFVGDFFLFKPLDLKKGNHRMIFDVNNRGNLTLLATMNNAPNTNDPSTPGHAGTGFLMREGYTILSAEWNWDVRPGSGRMQLDLPIATINGKPITQKIAAEIALIGKKKVSKCEPITWGSSRGFPAAHMDDRHSARLTVRDTPRGKRTLIPPTKWRFARLEGNRLIADPTTVYLESGFQLGKIYELVYVATKPRVGGLGLAAARDAMSFFRFNAHDHFKNLNPLAVRQTAAPDSPSKPDPEKVYIFGVSQSGRFITHLIYQGFHVDETGRMVIDGARIHVGGAGKGSFNHRFGHNTNVAEHLELNDTPADFFPFNFAPQEDPLTGKKGDVLEVARKLGKIPYIMVTNNESEYWTRSASLLHTDVLGTKDAPIHEKVRIYYTCGTGHYGSPIRERGIGEHGLNVLNHYPISRALLKALDRWATDGVLPPPSVYPLIQHHQLITAAQHKEQFPKIPGMRHPGRNFQPPRINYGETFWEDGIITVVPPQMDKPYATLVPIVDSDGNSLGGIRLPELQVPLGTYQGWNPRQAQFGAPNFMVPFEGSFWPFALTEAERKKNHDPRPSIEARYPTKQVYVEKVALAVKELIQQGLMLEEDGKRYVRSAQNMAWPPHPMNRYPFWQQEKKVERR